MLGPGSTSRNQGGTRPVTVYVTGPEKGPRPNYLLDLSKDPN